VDWADFSVVVFGVVFLNSLADKRLVYGSGQWIYSAQLQNLGEVSRLRLITSTIQHTTRKISLQSPIAMELLELIVYESRTSGAREGSGEDPGNID
jgi:hypothetical protein